MSYTKHYIPLECNPEVFTDLIHLIGVSSVLEFQDFYSLEDPVLSANITCPVLALTLVFSTLGDYEEKVAAREAVISKNDGLEEGDDVIWFKQTIHNASELLKSYLSLSRLDRAKTLEDSEALETAHRVAALQGDSKVPENEEDEVDYHYVCLVKSSANHHLYGLDGDLDGPVNHGLIGTDGDLLDEPGLDFLMKYIKEKTGNDVGFSILTLVISSANTGADV
ncbi:hypothetical protein ABVK25_005546 [Lepraria finkii]|uniref:Ubiquitin carboxyl-terminal hydrolase n=1 Tax=Lepraria finkii TaxID=1340010 RepID=A0ABR4B822_9LECA